MSDTENQVEKTEVELPTTTTTEEEGGANPVEGEQATTTESTDVVVEVAADATADADTDAAQEEEKVAEKKVTLKKAVSADQELEDEQWELIRSLIGEFVATWLFLFVTITTVVMTIRDSDSADAGSGKMTTGRHLMIALTFGISITVLVYQFATVSGANINPAVTFSLMVTRRMEKVKGFLYIVAQCCGAICGTLCVYGLDPATFKKQGGGCNGIPLTSSLENNVGAAFGVEFFGTLLLVLTVLAAIDPDNAKAAPHIGSLAPLTIGLAVFLAHCLAIPVTGTGINPARSFGTAVVSNNWNGHWVFWVAPMLAGGLGGLFYDLILSPDRTTAMKRLKNE
jgi:aquaporin PIP